MNEWEWQLLKKRRPSIIWRFLESKCGPEAACACVPARAAT